MPQWEQADRPQWVESGRLGLVLGAGEQAGQHPQNEADHQGAPDTEAPVPLPQISPSLQPTIKEQREYQDCE